MNVLVSVTHGLDIGKYETKPCAEPMDSATRLKVLQSEWKPPPGFIFVGNKEGKKTRYFRRDWLEKYPWLSYSNIPGSEGGFCKYCVLFSRESGGKGSQTLGVLVRKPLNKYKKALQTLDEHQQTHYHNFSVSQAEALVRVETKQVESVDVQLDEQKKKKLKDNRRKLAPIVKTIILCGQQNISLRGHRDCGRVQIGESNKEKGNFRALLRYRLDAGDNDLKEYVENSPSNCLMTSAQIQNELINSCGNIIKVMIADAVHKAGIFSLLADETTDVSTKEQLALGVRYVDVNKDEVREDFIGFMIVEKTTGKAIAESLVKKLESLQLSISDLRGQGYDGGSNMSGSYRGVQAEICAKQPLALYTHCASHRLNLAIGKACSVQNIRNTMGTMENISSFLSRSAARVLIMEKHVEELNTESNKKRLKPLCQTRWVERHDSVIVFYDLLPAIVGTLHEVQESTSDVKVASLAGCYLNAICNFQFVFALSACVAVFGITRPLSLQLQSPSVDITKAFELVDICTESLTACRDSHFRSVFKSAEEMATTLDLAVEVPRISTKQQHRGNVKTSSPYDHYRVNVFNPFVDYVLSEMKTRFPKEHPLLQLHQLIPSMIENLNIESVVSSANIYIQDLPNPTSLRSELIMWETRWKSSLAHDRPSTAIAAFKACTQLPNVKQLLQLLATIPVTTCCVERSFSALRRIKTDIRSTMNEERLEGLALMEIHNDVMIDVDKVIDDFAGRKNRRLLLL